MVATQSAAGAVVDDDPARRAAGERDPQLAAREPLGPGAHDRADRPPGDRVGDDVGRVGGGDDGPHAGPRRDPGRGELGGHAAAPPCGPGAAGDRLERGVDLRDLLDQRRVGVETRIGGEQARGVGEQHEHVGADEVRDQRGEPVVVAVADLVVGDGVVLVDDRDDTEVEEAAQRLARVQVLRAHAEVVGREQHLAREQPVPAEDRAEALHQPRLADRRDRLQRPDVGGAHVHAERGQAGGDRARADQHDLVTGGPCGGELLAQLGEATRRRARPAPR